MKLAGFFTDDTDEAGQVLEDLLVRHGPTPAELTAFTDLDQITTELESLSVRHDDVVQVPAKIKRAKQLLGVIHSQRKPRMALLRAGAEAHARKTFESDRAQQIVDRLDQAIKETNEAYRGYAKALGRTLRLAKRVAGETARLQDEQRNALNTVREWNGADPMEFDDVPTDYADETTLQVTGIATTLQSFHENPGSPMQVFNGAVSFGYTPHDANEAQHLLAHRSIADQCPPWSASGASRSQYDQLLSAALLREFKQDQLRSWPSFPGGANEVAEQIQFMADGIAATGRWNQSFVDGTIERLYHHETGDFDVYWRWLSTKV
jgi:hypothetical protein